MSATPPAPESRARRAVHGTLVALLFVLVAVVLFGRVVYPEVQWSNWSDRDMARSVGALADLPTRGAELNQGMGARIPGGAQYLIQNLLIGDGPPARLQRGVMILEALGVLALGWAAWRLAGLWAAAAAMAAHASATFVALAEAQVWNPALVAPLAAFGVASLVAATVDGRGWGVAAWCVLGAIGLQLHMSWLPWLFMGIGILLVLGPPRTLAWLALGLLLALGTYAPYLVDEAAQGWPNATLIASQPRFASPVQDASWTLRLGELLRVLTWLGTATVDASPGLAVSLRSVTLVGVIVALVAPPGPLGRAPAHTASLLALALAADALIKVSDASLPFMTRYYLVGAPIFAVVAAVGLERVARALRGWASSGARTVATLLLAASLWPAVGMSQRRPVDGFARMEALLEAVQAHTGWSFAEIAGRVVLLRQPDQLPWKGTEGVSYLLLRHGEAFAGSTPPPCGLLVTAPVPADEAAPLLRRALPLEQDTVQLIEVVQLEGFLTLVTYGGVAHCPTSLVDRYVDPPELEALHGRGAQPPPPGTVERADLPGLTRFTTNLAHDSLFHGTPGGRVHALVDLDARGPTLTATLRSAQLSGEAHLFGGWYVSALVRRPHLRVQDASGQTVEVPFSEGWVGLRAASTPLSTALPVLAPPLRLTLVLDAVDVGDDRVFRDNLDVWPPPDLTTRRAEVLLAEAFVPALPRRTDPAKTAESPP